jgi:hypothetical protein
MTMLAAYTTSEGSSRKVCIAPAADGCLLVIDHRVVFGHDPLHLRDALDAKLIDARLIARLAPDEPRVNADIACEQFLANPRRCRLITHADLESKPDPIDAATLERVDPDATLAGRGGMRYRLSICSSSPDGPRSPAEVRWVSEQPGLASDPSPVSTRHVVGSLEDYEPARTLALAAIARHRGDRAVTVTTLGAELRRLGSTPIVLNRLLREAVLESVSTRGLSMSAIALRCGRVKRDRRGNVSGETSWLTRRIGLAPEGGSSNPTPWVHSDVLALIARRGLGIEPHEVELG